LALVRRHSQACPPRSRWPPSDLGQSSGHSQDLVRAIVDFTEAIRLDPNRAEAYTDRGLCHASRYGDDQTIADLVTRSG